MNLLANWFRQFADRKRRTWNSTLSYKALEPRQLLAVTDLRLVTYNSLNFGTGSADRQDEFQTVFADLNADILVMQEVTSDTGAELLLGALNSGGQQYARANFVNGNDSDHSLYYRTSTVDLVSQNYIPTTLREFGEYTVSVSGTEFNIYSAHLKASTGGTNEQRRLDEVTVLRDHLETLPADSEFIVAGDFNVYDSDEPAYQKLTGSESNNAGRLEDLVPPSLVGDWHENSKFRMVHSQSPRTTSFGGGAVGGLDDRFDMIFGGFGLNDGMGVEYVTDSYYVHGNDGLHFNQSIIDGSNSSVSPAVAQALHDASDHLPVVADFQVITGTNGEVTITESNGDTTVEEAGASDSYELALDSVPITNVTVLISPDQQLDLGNGQGNPVNLTFTPSNALTPQTILVSAFDDAADEGTHSGIIQHVVTSADTDFDGAFVPDLTVEIGDNDNSIAPVVINEIYVNPPGTDDNREYIELRSASPNDSLANLWLLEIEGDGNGAGTVDAVQNLSSLSTGSNSLLTLGENYTTSNPWTLNSATEIANITGTRIENGSITFLLVEGFTGSSGTDLDSNNDGVWETTPWNSIVDSVGWSDGGSNDRVYSSVSLVQSGTPDAATRFPDDMGPSSIGAWFNGDIFGAGLKIDYNNSSSSSNLPAGAGLTPGAINYGSEPALEDFAFDESTKRGTASGGYLETHTGDDVYEVLTEGLILGNSLSRLAHVWTFDVTGGNEFVDFHLEAYHNSSVEDFQFGYTTDGGSTWNSMLTVAASSETTYSFRMPAQFSGIVQVGVRDTSRAGNEPTLDSIFIDLMYFSSFESSSRPHYPSGRPSDGTSLNQTLNLVDDRVTSSHSQPPIELSALSSHFNLPSDFTERNRFSCSDKLINSFWSKAELDKMWLYDDFDDHKVEIIVDETEVWLNINF